MKDSEHFFFDLPQFPENGYLSEDMAHLTTKGFKMGLFHRGSRQLLTRSARCSYKPAFASEAKQGN